MSERKIAVVTGANKGLGFAIVKKLCQKYDGIVYLTSRDEERGRKACEQLRELGYNPNYCKLDITNEESVHKFCLYIKEKYGKLDLLINNAGILFLKDATEPKIHQAEQTMLVNYFSLVKFSESVLPLITNGGKIINISSSSGHLSRIPSEELRRQLLNPELNVEELEALMNNYLNDIRKDANYREIWGYSPYVVSKVGVNAYTFILARRLKSQGIAANCVHPGYVMSDMTRGAGDVSTDDAAEMTSDLALHHYGTGLYFWHNGITVSWDGPDPRTFIDGKNVELLNK